MIMQTSGQKFTEALVMIQKKKLIPFGTQHQMQESTGTHGVERKIARRQVQVRAIGGKSVPVESIRKNGGEGGIPCEEDIREGRLVMQGVDTVSIRRGIDGKEILRLGVQGEKGEEEEIPEPGH